MAKTTEIISESGIEPDAKPRRRRNKKDDPPIATEEHQVVTTWKAERPVLTAEARPALPSESDDVDDDTSVVNDSLSLDDKVEQFLDRLQAEEPEYTAKVYRLPFYRTSQKTDTRSGRIHLGTIVFDPETYEDEISERWVRPDLTNAFYIEVRKDGQYHRSLPVLTYETEAADVEPATSPAAASMPLTNAIPIQPAPLETFEQQLSQVERFMGMMAKFSKLTNPAPVAVAPAPAPVEVTEESALVKLLMADDDTAAKLRKSALVKLIGVGSAPEPSWMEMTTLALQQGPVIVKAIFDGVAQLRAQSAPPGAPVTDQAAPAAFLPPDPQAEYQQLFNLLLTALEQNQPTANVAAAINGFLFRYPAYEQTVMGFLQLDTAVQTETIKQIPGAAQLAALPHAAQWLQSLRGEFFESEVEADDTTSIDNAA